MGGKIVLPGFVDAHIHLESSLVSPTEFAKAVLPHGTTTVITVPHEIANVMGTDGIEYMLQATEDLPVDVRFNSFAHSPQLVVEGQVVSVSGDLLTEPQTGVTYYLARVQVTPAGLKTLGKRQLQPGMPVEVVFKTGERSMLTYLLHPLIKRVSAAMKEE